LFKTFKGKVNGIIVVLVLFTGGFVLADSDAGIALQNWYNGLFDKAAEAFNFDYKKYLGDEIAKLSGDETQMKLDITNQATADGENALINTTSNVDSQKNEHLQVLNTKSQEISDYMGKQFDDLLNAATEVINSTTADSKQSITSGATEESRVSTEGAVTNIQGNLNETADTTITELENEISDVKFALEAQLNTEKEITTAEAKAIVDQKIQEIKNLIEAKKAELIAAQKIIITEEAKKIEDAIKSEMDLVITGM
jgi:hypothetical protein